jgi:multiple sugar transport system permease protein
MAGWLFWLCLGAFALGLGLVGRGLNRRHLGLGTRMVAGVLACLVVGVLVLPFVAVIVLGSFQRRADVLAGPHLIPPAFTAEFYAGLFRQGSIFGLAFRNSMLVAATTAVFTTLCAMLGGYAIARLRFRGRAAIHTGIMLAYMLPGIVLLIPLVGILKSLHLVDTLPGMFLGHSALFLPFVVWLMVGAFAGVDPDTEYAARVDGCTRSGALRRVVLPLTLPSVATTAVFAFLLSWNELMFAKVMYVSETPMLAPTIVNLMDPINRVEPQLSAAGLLSSLPVLILAFAMQRYIIRGIAEGSVK